MKACTGNRQLWAAAHAGVPWVPPLQGGWSCGSLAGSSCQERSCPEGGHCCCCYLLDKKKSQKPNNRSWHPAKVWRPPSLSVDLHTEDQVANSIGHFVSEAQLWSTYNFSIIRINSLGSVETQMITFFFLLWVLVFFPSSQKLVLMYSRLKFLK